MSDEWDSDCETALENLCTEVANGDEARALLAMLPAVRAALAVAFKAGYESGKIDQSALHEMSIDRAVSLGLLD